MTEDPETPACAHPILSMPFRAAERVVEQAGGRIGRRVAEHAAVIEARQICATCPRLAGCEDPDYEGVIGGRLQRGKYRGPKVAPAPLVEAAPRAEVSAPVDASSLLDFDFVTGLDPALEEERPRPRRRPAGWRVDVCRRCGCLIHRRDERCPGCAARRAEKLRPRVLTSVTTGGRIEP